MSKTRAAGRPLFPVSVLIPTRNEAANLGRCLDAVAGWADEIVVIDSQSTDGTIQLAESYRAKVIQFKYQGGWPKKRQWALENHQWKHDWILLLDADEILPPSVRREIQRELRAGRHDGYWVPFRIYFLGKLLRFGDSLLLKRSLFRRAKGGYEMRLAAQDGSMSDIEVHEHVVVSGSTGRLRNAVRHENFNSLDRYIAKHNEYSNWEAKVVLEGGANDLPPSFFGSQAQRRRWIKQRFMKLPGASLLYFIYVYFFRLGFLDGRPGLIRAIFKAVQIFHVKAKIYEMQRASTINGQTRRSVKVDFEGATSGLPTCVSALADKPPVAPDALADKPPVAPDDSPQLKECA